MDKKLLIFTDLDGTLLDSKYSFKKARSALSLLKLRNIPLVICSSKTRTEIEYYRRKLLNTHPFISENGGGIFIPINYFKFQIAHLKFHIKEEKKYHLIKLGTSYSVLRKTLARLRAEGFDIQGFGDMDREEIAELTGLKNSEARKAKQRDFDEPFIFNGTKKELKGKGSYIVPWSKYRENDTQNAVNKLTIIKYGDFTHFYINDEYLGEVPNLILYGNKAGFVFEGKQKTSVHSIHITRIEAEEGFTDDKKSSEPREDSHGEKTEDDKETPLTKLPNEK